MGESRLHTTLRRVNMATNMPCAFVRLAVVTIFWAVFSFSSAEEPMHAIGFDFEGSPGQTYEFRVEVTAGSKECFYQRLKKDTSFHVSFEVVRGGDKKINTAVRRPDGVVIATHEWLKEGSNDIDIEQKGEYEVCFHNAYSRFKSKLVHVYITTFVPAEWEEYAMQLQDLAVSVRNVTKELRRVDKAVSQMLKYQATSRRHAIADFYISHGKMEHVNFWSMVMIVVIVLTSCCQVFFVRRLFREQQGFSKPRA